MKAKVTAWTACLCMSVALTLQAQPVRNGQDIIWARDVAGAEMTLDGALDEDVWQQAETIELVWDDLPEGLPGSGQRTETSPTLDEPSDPNNGTIYLLRDGNTLWLGAMVQDKSIGGSTGLWDMDGLIMNILDRARLVDEREDETGNLTDNFFQGNRTEFFYSWWNGTDTTDATTTYDNEELVGSGQPLPGVGPRLHGFYGGPSAIEPRDEANVEVWDARTVVDGISNDDTHGDDVGYTMEMRIDFSALGYDFTQAEGDKAAWNIALNDQDYNWPSNPDLSYLSRVWWQNQWGNNFNEGIAYIYGAPGVTVDSGEPPQVTEPEFTIPNGELVDTPTIDGALDEEAWEEVDPAFYVQYQGDRELLDMNPEVAKYYVFYFRPDLNGDDPNPIVVDPSVARFKMFFKENTLYVGVDVDDQAISGVQEEGGRDGIRLFLRDRDSLTTQGTLHTRVYEFQVDSSGALVYGADALELQTSNPDALTAGLALKGASTAADPTDVDEGYQLEIAIDLVEALGYPDGLGDGRLWTSMNFFDGDHLENASASYATRTWIVNERAPGGVIYGYMNPDVHIGTAVEDVAEVPRSLELLGNYPNPFNPTTTLRYVLPQSGEVTIQVFDVLGRRVATIASGMRAAGLNEAEIDASSLASGVYLYRVQVTSQTGGDVQASAVGRMMLLK